MQGHIELRFYAALNDFLPADKRKRSYDLNLTRNTSVKDLIESQGVPHTEVELILVNGQAVGFDYLVADGDRIAVYPVFENLDITPELRLREAPATSHSFCARLSSRSAGALFAAVWF